MIDFQKEQNEIPMIVTQTFQYASEESVIPFGLAGFCW